MDRKGFTLIEIIITVTLIALVSIMFTNSFDTISKNNRKTEYQRMVSTLNNAVEVYLEQHREINSLLYVGKGYLIITIEDLIKSGNIARDMNDPTTQKPINQNNKIYVFRDEYGSISIDYPHKDSDKECYFQSTPLMIPLNTTINDSILYQNLNNYAGIARINSDGNLVTLTKTTNISVTGNNIVSSKIGTYQIEYRFQDCYDSSVWRLGSRTVIVY